MLKRMMLAGWVLWVGLTTVGAAEWQIFTNCTLVGGQANDGDSFLVQTGEQQLHIRLYFVDCPETSASSDADAKRIREQARHYGLTDPARVVHYGKAARAFTEEQLARPFEVQTTFAMALGRSTVRRVYGLVTTAAGKDLGTLLVANGLARTYGVSRALSDGTSGAEMMHRLADWETRAMLKRLGVWADTDPDSIVTLREDQRREDRELDQLRTQIEQAPAAARLVDLNRASARELQSLAGIGPVLAARIISNRPYRVVADLQKVNGVSERMYERLAPHVTVTAPAP